MTATIKKSTTVQTINPEQFKKAGEVFKAVSHPIRLSILTLIEQSEKEEATVGEIYRTLKLEQSIASTHLKWLRDRNIVHARRQGKNIFYSINEQTLQVIIKAAAVLS